MAYYTGQDCPICENRFQEEDDIVVCPICGAPYHRECYARQGDCSFEARHTTGYVWQPAQKPKENICPSCKSENPSDSIFCRFCGELLRRPGEQEQGYSRPLHQQSDYLSAFGGLSPDELIDGISARDIALFVGENSHYYLPRFKAISQKRSGGINWAAFLLDFIFFFYRKMYKVGALLLGLVIITQIPSLFMLKEYTAFIVENFNDISIGIRPVFEPKEHLWAYSAAFYLRYVTLAADLFMSFFSNRIYKWHVFRKIRRIRVRLTDDAGKLDERAYVEALASEGRTRHSIAVFIGAVALTAYFGVSWMIASSAL